MRVSDPCRLKAVAAWLRMLRVLQWPNGEPPLAESGFKGARRKGGGTGEEGLRGKNRTATTHVQVSAYASMQLVQGTVPKWMRCWLRDTSCAAHEAPRGFKGPSPVFRSTAESTRIDSALNFVLRR